MSNENTVEIRGLSRVFGTNTVLNGLDLDIRQGEFVALLGRSGSGKSTLLRTLAGLDPMPAGAGRLPQKRSVVFQEPRLVPWKRVLRNVAIGLRDARAADRAVTALSEVGLAAKRDAWPLTLSGGEAARVALARALVRDPALLLLDEPFAALDALTRMTMQDLVLSLWAEHRCSVLLVTHDIDEALIMADRILLLDRGTIVMDRALQVPREERQGHAGLKDLRFDILGRLGVELKRRS